jgi:hypothetical protein
MDQFWNGDLIQRRFCFGGAKPPRAAPLPQVEQQIDAAGQQGNEAERRRRRAASGYSSTFLTGGSGLSSAANIAKTSLGA